MKRFKHAVLVENFFDIEPDLYLMAEKTSLNFPSLEAAFEQIEGQGWELVAVIDSINQDGNMRYYFKREVESE